MQLTGRTPTRPSHTAATPAQLTLRSALAAYFDKNDPTRIIEALQSIQNDATHSSGRSVVNPTLIQRLIEVLKETERSQNTSTMTPLIDLIGRLDRLLGWQMGKARHADQPQLDQMAESLIDELAIIEATPRHPLARWRSGEASDPSGMPIDFLAPWPATGPQTLNHWVGELGSEMKWVVPASMVKALIDAPELSPIETDPNKNLWGFWGAQWADTALPAIALLGRDHYQSPLSICLLILQTPLEVAAEFGHFGLVCPTLPSVASAEALSVEHHRFIDWVAVVRAMKALFK